MFYGLSHSTIPSFSTPITAVGKAYDYLRRGTSRGHGNIYGGFRFVPEGGEAINIETQIILPDEGLLRISTDARFALFISRTATESC